MTQFLSHHWKSLIFAGCLCLPAAVKAGDTATVDSFHVASTFTSRASTDPFGRSLSSVTIRYRLYVPKNYNPAVKYPIVLTLHGTASGGTDNRAQLKFRFSRMWADDTLQAKQAMFVLAPQSNATTDIWVTILQRNRETSWRYDSMTINPALQAAIQLYDSIKTAYSIDTTRQYVSGYSAGGYATYYLLNRFPRQWAAAVPACACGDTNRAIVNTWLNTPIWMHQGSADTSVSVSCSRQMFASLNRAYAALGKDTANTLRYSEYPGADHTGGWENASRDPKVMPWAISKLVSPTAIRRGPQNFRKGASGMVKGKPIDALGHKNSKFPSLKNVKISNP